MQTETGPTVPIRYTCKGCQTVERVVEVHERHAAQPVAGWVEMVREAVGADHAKNQPACCSSVVDLKIPLSGPGGYVGQARRQ